MGFIDIFFICLVATRMQEMSAYDTTYREPSNVKSVNGNQCPSLSQGNQVEDVVIEPFIQSVIRLSDDVIIGGRHTVDIVQMTPSYNEHCWFTYDSITQLLTLLPDKNVLKQQPVEGYKFKMHVKNQCNDQTLQIFFNIRIKNPDTSHISCLTIDIEVELKEPAHSACEITATLDINRRIGVYLDIGSTFSHIYEYELLSRNSNNLKISMDLIDITKSCKNNCRKDNLQSLAYKFISEFGVVNSAFKQALGPNYNIHSGYTNTDCRLESTRSPSKGSLSTSCIEPTVNYGLQDLSVPAFHLTRINIPDDIFQENQLQFSLTIEDQEDYQLCWFRVKDSEIQIFPTRENIGQQTFHFTLTATNSCGKSKKIHFKVSIEPQHRLPCFLFDVTFHGSSTSTCVFELLEEVNEYLSDLTLKSLADSKPQIISYAIQNDKVVISLTTQQGGDCSFCTQSYTDSIVDQLSVQNLKSKRQFFSGYVIQDVYISSGCVCSTENNINKKPLSFHAKAGVVNKFQFLGSNINKKMLSLPENNKHLWCLKEQELWFLPWLPESRNHHTLDDVDKVMVMSECGTVNSLIINIDNTKLKKHSCYSITLKALVVEGTCILQTINDVVNAVSKELDIPHKYIVIMQHSVIKIPVNSHGQTFSKELLLKLVFSSDCSDECSYKNVKRKIPKALYLQKIANSKTTDAPTFIIRNVTFNECVFDAGAFGILRTIPSFVPLWVYLIPGFLVLLLLLVFFLVYCCCCRAKNYRCCCYSNRKVHRVTSSYPPMNVIECKRYVSPETALIKESSSSTVHKTISNELSSKPQVMAMNSSNINARTSEHEHSKMKNAGSAAYATIEVLKEKATSDKGTCTDQPLLNKQSTTTTTRETLYSRKCVNNDPEQPHAAKSTMEQFYTKQPLYTTLNGDNDDQEVRQISKRSSSRRIRSYSDGFILDELNLPSPPCSKNDALNKSRSHQRVCRTERNPYNDDMLVGATRKITIPFKMTARVKNISRSCDDILNTSRMRYVKFDDRPEDHGDLDALTFPRKKRFLDRDITTRRTFRMPSSSKDSFTTKRYVVESWKDDRQQSTDDLSKIRLRHKDMSSKMKKSSDGGVFFSSSKPTKIVFDDIWTKPIQKTTTRYKKFEHHGGTSEY